MKTRIEGILCGLMVAVAGTSAVAVENETKSSPADSLRQVSTKDLPARAVELVRLADAKDRQSVAVQAVKVAVELNPDATITIVKSVCEALPESAPAIAAAAARLEPAKAPAIAQAAAKVAPDKAASIVYALCNQAPGQYRAIAVGVAKIVPSAAKEILRSVAATIPDLRVPIDQSLATVGQVSVDSVLAQANRIQISPLAQPVIIQSPTVANVSVDQPHFFSPFRGWFFPRFSFHRAPPAWFWWTHFRPHPPGPGPGPGPGYGFPWWWWPRHFGGHHHGGGGHNYCAP